MGTLLEIYPENNQKKFIQGELDALQMHGLILPNTSEDLATFTFESKQLLEVCF